MNSRALSRFALTIHYDGTPFHGWQLQPETPTVQGELEAVLERLTGARRAVVGSGRTDRGVHARGQVASVDLPARWTAPELRQALNALLPREIWVQEARRVSSDFHPRYDARERSYRYHLGTAPEAASPFHRRWCWDASEWEKVLELNVLQATARLLPGERSFARFAKAGQPERGERCRVLRAGWRPWTDVGYVFEITANRYLHRMVRYLVGTMVDVARSKRPLEEFRRLLEDPDTELRTSPPAPPEGLFLFQVAYGAERWGNDPDRDPLSSGTNGI